MRGLGDTWKRRGQLVDEFVPGDFSRICELLMLFKVTLATSTVTLSSAD